MFSDLADSIKTLRKRGVRHILLQMLSFTSALASCLMMWEGLCLVTNTESPVVVVLSGSMEPAFHRGDLIFLINPPKTRYQTGDITVYKIPGQDIPIVHRVIETHDMVKTVDGVVESIVNPGDQLLLTKGDNNAVDDVELYRGLSHLERKHIVGKVRGFLPYVGYVTIAMESLLTELRKRTKKLIILQNDFPQLKYAVFGGLGLVALIQRG